MSDAIKDGKIWLLSEVLSRMDKLIYSPDREKFCVNFDREYQRRMKEYKKLTGREWSGGNAD